MDAVRAGAVLVDIRSELQRQADGVIAGALFYPRNVLEWRVDPASGYSDPALGGDVSKRLIVFCSEGYQSSLVAATLRDLGFTEATDLVGGFSGVAGGGASGRVDQCVRRAAMTQVKAGRRRRPSDARGRARTGAARSRGRGDRRCSAPSCAGRASPEQRSGPSGANVAMMTWPAGIRGGSESVDVARPVGRVGEEVQDGPVVPCGVLAARAARSVGRLGRTEPAPAAA